MTRLRRASLSVILSACSGGMIAAACGAYGEDEELQAPSGDAGGGGDGAINATSPPDAGGIVDAMDSDATSCRGAFDAPVRVASLSSGLTEFSVRLTRNERSAYVARPITSGTSQMYLSTRTTRGADDFGAAVLIEGLGTTAQSIAFGAVTANEQTMVYQIRPEDGGLASVFRAQRAPLPGATTPRFENAQLVIGPSSATGEPHAPYLNDNGDAVWFDLPNPTAGRRIVARVPLGNATPSSVQMFPELGDATNPVVSSDELEVFYTRTGSDLLFHATRPSSSSQLGVGSVVSATVINATPSWISPDSCRLYVVINADASSDVFMMRRAAR